MVETASGLPSVEAEEVRTPPSLKILLLLPLVRSRFLVVLCVTIGGAIALAQSLLYLNVYEARGELQVKFGQREHLTSDIGNPLNQNFSQSNWDMDSEKLVLNNPDLFKLVLETLDPKVVLHVPDPRSRDNADTPFYIRWLHELQAALTMGKAGAVDELAPEAQRDLALQLLRASTVIAPDYSSRHMIVTYRTTDEATAVVCAQAILDACIKHHNSIYSLSDNLKDVEDALTLAEAAAADADYQLSEYMDTCDIDDDLDSLLADVRDAEAALERELETKARRLEVVKGELALREKALAALPPELEIKRPALVEDNRLFVEKYDELQILKREYRTKLLIEGAGATATKALAKQVEEVQKELDLIPPTRTVPVPSDIVPNPEYQRVRQIVGELDIERVGLTKECELLIVNLKAKKERISQIVSCMPKLSQLKTDVELRRAEHKDLAARFANYDQGMRLEEKQRSNLQITQRAIGKNGQTVGPNRRKYLALGLGAGFLLGAVIALLRWYRDGTIRHPEQLERVLALPVLHVIPRTSAWRRASRA
ncbi:MAG: hypothetical protein ACKVX7_11960 [Planctomycetota bacterium]